MKANMNRKGISNVVATIILIAVAIALAVAVAVWVFGIAGSSAKTSALNVQVVSLTVDTSSQKVALVLMISNPSSGAIDINAFTLGSETCTASSSTSGGSNLLVIPGGSNYVIQIVIPGTVQQQSIQLTGPASISITSGGSQQSQPIQFTCTGNQIITPGVQYSGTIVTTSGQTYPFTITAQSGQVTSS